MAWHMRLYPHRKEICGYMRDAHQITFLEWEVRFISDYKISAPYRIKNRSVSGRRIQRLIAVAAWDECGTCT